MPRGPWACGRPDNRESRGPGCMSWWCWGPDLEERLGAPPDGRWLKKVCPSAPHEHSQGCWSVGRTPEEKRYLRWWNCYHQGRLYLRWGGQVCSGETSGTGRLYVHHHRWILIIDIDYAQARHGDGKLFTHILNWILLTAMAVHQTKKFKMKGRVRTGGEAQGIDCP